MPIDRFFSDADLLIGTEISLQDQEFHHLSRVTRTKEGEHVEVVNGKGVLAHAVIESIKKREALLRIDAVEKSPPSSFKTILVQAIPRINRLDLIVEKGTELGMEELWLFPGEKSEKKTLSDNQMKRLEFISISALKQCGRLYLPKIAMHTPLAKWKNFPQSCYFGDLSKNSPTILSQWTSSPPSKELYFFIGPESGFTDNETKILQNEAKALGVSMHRNILRTDTAAIAALAIINHLSMAGVGEK